MEPKFHPGVGVIGVDFASINQHRFLCACLASELQIRHKVNPAS